MRPKHEHSHGLSGTKGQYPGRIMPQRPIMPFLSKPSVSTDLLKEIELAEEVHSFIQKTIPDAFVGDTDQKILIAALFSLAMEHHDAILYLLRAGQYDGSAATLVRPLIDCCYRAH